MLVGDRNRWWIKQIDKLEDGELDEQKCTQKIGILPGPTKKWRIKRIDELNDDELDEFYCTVLVSRDAGKWEMIEALSSLPFEKGGNEGGNAFVITVSGQFLDLWKSNSIKFNIAGICATRKFRMVVTWWLLHI